ncbi:hypothetical protein RvY_11777 [Ramazzottius varieornatus]|uniref:Cytochrome b5 heme-binding domain-containing protein n=1 Tax=Ramazzottius varieornatus TaxID=947166 RepID=A0A1D1VHB0_RAMVA|nr:hypothetical protein RvY_11777 [Ramazzottius varieornatus]
MDQEVKENVVTEKVVVADNSTIVESGASEGGLYGIVQDIVQNPLNLILLSICFYLLWKIIQERFLKKEAPVPKRSPPLPKLPKRDFTLAELRSYDGTASSPDGRILVAINGKVFDVTRGKSFYGPGGAYDNLAGHDASRALATFALGPDAFRDTYDDLSDLTIDQMNTMKDWEAQFQDKYDLVGRLLRPGEAPHDYAIDDEEESSNGPSTGTSTPARVDSKSEIVTSIETKKIK